MFFFSSPVPLLSVSQAFWQDETSHFVCFFAASGALFLFALQRFLLRRKNFRHEMFGVQ